MNSISAIEVKGRPKPFLFREQTGRIQNRETMCSSKWIKSIFSWKKIVDISQQKNSVVVWVEISRPRETFKHSTDSKNEIHICLDICLKTTSRKIQSKFQEILIHTPCTFSWFFARHNLRITFSKNPFLKSLNPNQLSVTSAWNRIWSQVIKNEVQVDIWQWTQVVALKLSEVQFVIFIWHVCIQPWSIALDINHCGTNCAQI